MLYLVYTEGYAATADDGLRRDDVAEEAIARGVALVERALRMRRPPGRYALEATIAALHAQARTAEATDWPQILAVYAALRLTAPSPVVELNRAVALAEVEGPEPALVVVEAISDRGDLARYAPLHAVRADLLRRLGRPEAYAAAAALDDNPAERAFLAARAQPGASGPT